LQRIVLNGGLDELILMNVEWKLEKTIKKMQQEAQIKYINDDLMIVL